MAETRKVASLTPYGKNAKKHPKKQVEQVAASIREFGFNQPIVVDKAGVVIVGHGRLEAAKLLGLAEVPVIVADLTEEQAAAYRLADNKLNESEWDMALVIEELKLLSEPMVELTGFDSDLLLEPDEKDDALPEDVEPRAKLGDLYELGDHRLLVGDSTNAEDFNRIMDGKKADMVFTDPPYGVSYVGKTKDALTIENDALDDDGSLRDFLTNVFKNVASVTKRGGGWYVAAPAGPLHNTFGSVLKALGVWRQTITWVKDAFVLGRSDYHYRHEPIFYGWLEGEKHQFYAGRTEDTVWEIPRPKRSAEHPTMKPVEPVELVERAITNSSKSEDIVLDPFLGSGTTLIAAEKTGRTCYGMELDPKYADVIIKRWEDYTGLKAQLISPANE
jgi:site-specific DNA-methyltransferase (adenine-specific)